MLSLCEVLQNELEFFLNLFCTNLTTFVRLREEPNGAKDQLSDTRHKPEEVRKH